MKNLAAVVRRDLAANRVVFITAAFAGLLPIISLVARPTGWNRVTHISVMTGILSLAMAGGAALLTGSLMIGGELPERRMSFYFSRPISAGSIWYGKVLAAAATAAVAGLIALIPSLFIIGSWKQSWPADVSVWAACIIAAVIPLALIAHGVSTVLRSRSLLVVLDLAMVTISGTLLWLLLRPVINAMAWRMATTEISVLAVLLTLCLLVAGQVQVAVGRCDVRQSHSAFSRALWLGVGVVVVITALFTLWLTSAAPGDLDDGHVIVAPRGPWAEVTGVSKARLDFPSISLVNTVSGRIIRISPIAGWWQQRVKFSGDGQHAFWLDQEGRDNWVVAHARLDTANVERTSLRFAYPVFIQPSGDGTRLVIDDNASIGIHDVASGRLLASFRVPQSLPKHWWSKIGFVDADTVRVTGVSNQPGTLEALHELDVYEFSIPTRQLRQTGRLQMHAASFSVQPASPDNQILALSVYHAGATREIFERFLIDGRTTAIIRRFAGDARPDAAGSHTSLPREPRMLMDGSLATLVPAGGGVALRIESRGSVRDFPLSAGRGALIGSELAPGVVPVGLMVAPPSGDHSQVAHWDTVVIDTRTGSVARRIAGRVPVSALSRFDFDTIPQPGSDGARLFASRHLGLTRWSPGENERIVIPEK